MIRGCRRGEKFPDHAFLHVELVLFAANPQQSVYHHPAFIRGEALNTRGSVLRRENAHPDFFYIWICRPKVDKLRNIIRAANHGTRDSAMHRYVMAFDISKDSIIRRRLAPNIVLRLQSIDGNDYLQILKFGPRRRDWTEGAGDNCT